MHHAHARSQGMELASGRGKMRPLPWDERDFKDEPWEGSVPLPDERRNPILIWGRGGKVMKINDPKDGFAGYGRYYKGFEYRSDIRCLLAYRRLLGQLRALGLSGGALRAFAHC